MSYILMHKNINTAVIDLNESGEIVNAAVIQSGKEHLPVGVEDRKSLSGWWRDRSIPDTREFIRKRYRDGHPTNGLQILKENRGLSMSDCYWIRDETDASRWEDVNLFENNFEDRHAVIHLVGQQRESFTSLAPGSSEGELEKFWTIGSDGTRRLVKGNFGSKVQQSLNEVFSSRLLDLIGWKDHVEYSMVNIHYDGSPSIGCICNAYTSQHCEEVSAYQLLMKYHRYYDRDTYQSFLDVCEREDLDRVYVDDFLQREIIADYIMTNTDRHLRNIAILRDPDTLQIIGMAPMYDFGNSMFFRIQGRNDLPNHKALLKTETHSFNRLESSLLRHVRSKFSIEWDKILDRKTFDEVYGVDQTKPSDFYEGVYALYCYKIQLLQNLMAGREEK